MAIFTNQATLTYNNGVTNSNVVTGEIVEVLSAEKTAVLGTYTTGDTVTYVISIVNSGTAPYTGLTVTDNLGEYPVGTGTAVPLEYIDGSLLYFVNGVLAAAPAADAGAPLVISGVSVPAGGNALLIYKARITDAAPLNAESSITNVAEISGGGLSTPITVTETVTAGDSVELTISKALSPETVVENGQLTYTFVIRNAGNTPAVAADNLTVTDTFDPILDPITVQLDGVTLTEGVDYTYDTETGEFATVEGRITVPAATYSQDPVTGVWTVTPGVAVLRVIGTV
ncbi:MAG: hypothetical protein IJ428_02545 [Clostridia bacterium]|nr:hypothetical protein [Clostridia bacterium]